MAQTKTINQATRSRIDTRTAASLVGVNKTTASQYFLRLGQLMYEHRDEVGFFEGEVEIEERYFGGKRTGK